MRGGPVKTCIRMGGMPIPGTPSRAELVDHLVKTRIAGEVATPRENNLSHYRQLANGNRHYWLGLELGDRWSDEQDVLAVMAERVGVNDDPEYRYGQDTIDPELTVGGLERMAARLRKAADGQQRVLFATGHPGGLLEVHHATAAALRSASTARSWSSRTGSRRTRGTSCSSRTWRSWSTAPRCGTPTPATR